MCSHHVVTSGHAADVRTFAERVEAIGETLGDLPLQVAAHYYLGFACHISGDYHGTVDACWRLMAALQGERARERFGVAVFPAVQSRAYLARSLAELGTFDEGEAHGQEAIRIAEALDHPFNIVWACLHLAYLNSTRGELSQAARLLERAFPLCGDWSITILTPMVIASLGHVYARAGRVAEGVSWLQQALTAYESGGLGLFHSICVVQAGEAYLLADQVEDARACADRAVLLARERSERGYEAWALRLLGDIASCHDRPDVATAEAYYGAAMALAAELGMRPVLAHCRLGLGKLYRRTGARRQAHDHLTVATAMNREMDMRFWREQADAEMKELV